MKEIFEFFVLAYVLIFTILAAVLIPYWLVVDVIAPLIGKAY